MAKLISLGSTLDEPGLNAAKRNTQYSKAHSVLTSSVSTVELPVPYCHRAGRLEYVELPATKVGENGLYVHRQLTGMYHTGMCWLSMRHAEAIEGRGYVVSWQGWPVIRQVQSIARGIALCRVLDAGGVDWGVMSDPLFVWSNGRWEADGLQIEAMLSVGRQVRRVLGAGVLNKGEYAKACEGRH